MTEGLWLLMNLLRSCMSGSLYCVCCTAGTAASRAVATSGTAVSAGAAA